MYYGHVYGLDANTDTLYAIHFESAERYNEYTDSYYFLKRTKILHYYHLYFNNIIKFLSREEKDNPFLSFSFKSAWLIDNSWWSWIKNSR